MSAAPAATLVGVELGERSLVVSWSQGPDSTFHYLWLRDNCPQLLHAETHHRVVETSCIPEDVHPSGAWVDTGTELRVRWAHDGHESRFTSGWLVAHDYSNGRRRSHPEPALWDASIGDALPRASYPELLADTAVRRRFLAGFRDYGLGVLFDVPVEPGTVLRVAEEFGEIRTTSWGRIFDVVSMAEANSVAYTNLPLVTHTDEGYRDPAPTVQLQHFLVSDASGGASTLVDGWKIAQDLRNEAPDQFELLRSTSIHFHFRDATAEHEHDGPVIEVGPEGRVRAVRWSNHSAQPFLMEPSQLEEYYRAYREFGRRRESEQYQLRLAMQAGELYMVDNRRVLHGRTGFAADGARHLQSCYIERDELVSRLAMLERLTTTA